MTEENTILYKSKPFVLGVCNCGCKAEIGIRRLDGTTILRFKRGHNAVGEKNNFWKGGIKYSAKGYKMILKKDHPYAGKYGYVFEHRLVMEQYLGRYLKPEEIVHHKNENKLDNRIENLELHQSNKDHKRQHILDMSDRKCKICNSVSSYVTKIKGHRQWRKFEDGYACTTCFKRKLREKLRIERSGTK